MQFCNSHSLSKVTLLFLVLYLGVNTQNSAPSSYLNGEGYVQNGDILVRTIRAAKSTQATYFCTMGFNTGAEGGGYAGIQDSPDYGRTFYYIFSLWDPSNRQPITAKYVGPGTVVSNFGGEGTGLKSMNGNLGWTIGEWYTLVLRRWDENNHTMYGYWVKDIRNDKWTHLVTMNYPVPNVYFNGGIYTFLEDWLSTGQNERRFELKDGYIRSRDGSWISESTMSFSVNQGDISPGGRSYNYRYAYDAGITNNAFYYQTGGNTRNTCSNQCRLRINQPSRPEGHRLIFSIRAETCKVEWNLSPGSSPLFKYTISINGRQIRSEIESETFSTSVNINQNDVVDVELEDIFGNVSRQQARATICSNFFGYN